MRIFLHHRIIPVFLALAAGAVAAQPLPSDVPRRAVRCSIVSGMAADNARSQTVKESSRTLAKLMMKLANANASKSQVLEWLDEMERDLKSANAAQMQSMVSDCKALLGEQSEAIEQLARSDSAK